MDSEIINRFVGLCAHVGPKWLGKTDELAVEGGPSVPSLPPVDDRIRYDYFHRLCPTCKAERYLSQTRADQGGRR